jgi:hypothetical protein
MSARSANVAKVCLRSYTRRIGSDPEVALGGFPVAVAEVVQVEVAAAGGGEEER